MRDRNIIVSESVSWKGTRNVPRLKRCSDSSSDFSSLTSAVVILFIRIYFAAEQYLSFSKPQILFQTNIQVLKLQTVSSTVIPPTIVFLKCSANWMLRPGTQWYSLLVSIILIFHIYYNLDEICVSFSS